MRQLRGNVDVTPEIGQPFGDFDLSAKNVGKYLKIFIDKHCLL